MSTLSTSETRAPVAARAAPTRRGPGVAVVRVQQGHAVLSAPVGPLGQVPEVGGPGVPAPLGGEPGGDQAPALSPWSWTASSAAIR